MSKQTTRGDRTKAPDFGETEVLCGCANLTYAGYRSILRENPGISFEDILERTASGGTCTACLLDLEYHFAEIQGRAADRGVDFAPGAVQQAVSLKRRLYERLDGMSPLLPYRKRTWSPVLFGPEIEQWLRLANHALLYGDIDRGGAVVPIRAGVVIRDATGTICFRQGFNIPEGGDLCLNLSAPLAAGDGTATGSGLGIGSAEVTLASRRPGMWGTTRPQFEIVTQRAACAVHVQAPGPAGEHGFACLYRPEDERLFYTVNNPRPRALQVACRYEIAVGDGRLAGQADGPVTIPPMGAWIGEIAVQPEHADTARGRLVELNWRISGQHKLHLLCASSALDRFSIDHL